MFEDVFYKKGWWYTLNEKNELMGPYQSERAARAAKSKEQDCGDNSCRYAKNKGGMRTNGGCRCDTCPECGAGSKVVPHWTWCSYYGK